MKEDWISVEQILPDHYGPLELLHKEGIVFEDAYFLGMNNSKERRPLFVNNYNQNEVIYYIDITHWRYQANINNT